MNLALAWVLIFFIAAAFASRWVLSKWVLNDKVSPHTVYLLSTGCYFVGAVAAIASVAAVSGSMRSSLASDIAHTMDWRHWVILCGFPIVFAIAGYLVVYILSTMNVSVLYPVYNALMLFLTILCSFLFLKEQVTVLLSVGLTAIFVGLGMIVANSYVYG